ncbi:hypothetical protein HG530_002818 [Fusarium avenaceum]|nr:hypothetical protein HG530_002818 [Fusarium avenaceum]KIL91064.1 hypothetical protein FAVG1_05761 [Fusarium avenaceum]
MSDNSQSPTPIETYFQGDAGSETQCAVSSTYVARFYFKDNAIGASSSKFRIWVTEGRSECLKGGQLEKERLRA